jgi:hypothetical protein
MADQDAASRKTEPTQYVVVRVEDGGQTLRPVSVETATTRNGAIDAVHERVGQDGEEHEYGAFPLRYYGQVKKRSRPVEDVITETQEVAPRFAPPRTGSTPGPA